MGRGVSNTDHLIDWPNFTVDVTEAGPGSRVFRPLGAESWGSVRLTSAAGCSLACHYATPVAFGTSQILGETGKISNVLFRDRLKYVLDLGNERLAVDRFVE